MQRLTRGILLAQEGDRATKSRRLRDDIAQVLLGVQVKLADLRKETARNTTGLKKEIASTQRVVEKSAKTLEGSAGGFGLSNEKCAG
jgi:signal transduction histidine kinase